jgi:prepilin-type N-terminal cleavage/methylation domain-containing protein
MAVKVRSSKGFSLIELIIVIAIFGIVLAIAASNFTAYRDNTNLREAARSISSDMLLVKQRAVSESRNYRIDFSEAANTYTIQQETAPASGIYSDLSTKPVGAGNTAIKISGTPSFSGGVSYVTFQPRGTCNPFGSMKLKNDRRPLVATITTQITGRVRVEYAS